MSLLPIYSLEDELVTTLRNQSVAFVEAPTGSGKSTQVPQMLLDHGITGSGQIVVLQPRRLAARMLARRVATERGCRLGDEVGYQVRFDNVSSAATRIKYETDGIILRQLQGDPALREVSAVIFDEFHERHLYSDIMLGLAKRLLEGNRPDLRIVIMSATLDTRDLAPFLGGAPILRTQGRAFPVDVRHVKPNATFARLPPWQQVARELPALLREQLEGHVLVFMPGAYEIRRTAEEIKRLPAARDCIVAPLYGSLTPEQQDIAVAPSVQRKIIVATNVAETSLTIDGVTVVVDSGLVRRARFDPQRGINALLVEKTSRASSAQRAGRAGRTAPGICLRLWPEREQSQRQPQEAPELLNVDLSETLLQLKAAGVDDEASFPWITPPPEASLTAARQLLGRLGALDRHQQLTELGRRMAVLPLHPRFSRMLIAAEFYGCVPTTCLVAAMLQERSILLTRQNASVRERQLALLNGCQDSDMLLLIRLWEEARRNGFHRDACESIGVHGAAARTVGQLQEQLINLADQQRLDCYELDPPPEGLYRAILAGFADHVSLRTGNHCLVVGGRRGTVDKHSIVPRSENLLVASDIREIGQHRGETDVIISGLTAIRREWLSELFPNGIKESREVFLERTSKQVRAERRLSFWDLPLETSRLDDVTADEAADVLAAEILAGRITLKKWDDTIEQWIARINLVARVCPELGISPINNEQRLALARRLCHDAYSAKSVKQADVWPVMEPWLGTEAIRAVQSHAPETVEIQNGRTPKVRYDHSAAPRLALRIQELYDTHENPTICMGRVRVQIQILAPNQRPIQVTDDISEFWKDGYEQAKKEFQGRYPKHEWR